MNNTLLLLSVFVATLVGCSDKPREASADEVSFDRLNWTWGGFDGSRATLDAPRIRFVAANTSRDMSIHWDVDMRSWGYAPGQADGVACLFVKKGGVWVGGKFEWISSSRTYRSFNNPLAGYGGWDAGALRGADELAFVVVSKCGRKRSNVALWKRQ